MLLQSNFKMIEVTILNFVGISNLFTNIKGKILQKEQEPCYLYNLPCTWIALEYSGKSVSDTVNDLPLI